MPCRVFRSILERLTLGDVVCVFISKEAAKTIGSHTYLFVHVCTTPLVFNSLKLTKTDQGSDTHFNQRLLRLGARKKNPSRALALIHQPESPSDTRN